MELHFAQIKYTNTVPSFAELKQVCLEISLEQMTTVSFVPQFRRQLIPDGWTTLTKTNDDLTTYTLFKTHVYIIKYTLFLLGHCLFEVCICKFVFLLCKYNYLSCIVNWHDNAFCFVTLIIFSFVTLSSVFLCLGNLLADLSNSLGSDHTLLKPNRIFTAGSPLIIY